MKNKKLIKQLNNYQLFRIFTKRRDKTVKIKVKKKALVSVLLSFVMIMGLFFVPQVNAEDNNVDQGNTISFRTVQRDLETVDGIILEVDGVEQRISYPAGLITDNLDALDKHLKGTQTFQKAVIRDSINHTETEIARIGTYDDKTYYSLNDQQDIGIELTDNQNIVFICASKYTVTYQFDNKLGTVTGPSELFKGEDLNIAIQANETYHIQAIKLNGKPIAFSNNKDASVKIEGTEINEDVILSVEFAQDDSYLIIEKGHRIEGNTYVRDEDGIQQGSLCLNNDTEVIPYVNPGDTATFWLYSDSNTGGSEWVLNMLRINDIDMKIPYGSTPNTPESQSTTNLDNGSTVTIKMIHDDFSIKWKGDENQTPDRIRTIYEITITNISEDITIEGNFKQKDKREIIITGLEGIDKVGATDEQERYKGYWGANGNHYFYEMQPNDGDTVYSVSYNDGWIDGDAINIYLFSVKDGYNPYTVDLNISFSGIEKNLYGNNGVINTRFQKNGKWMTIEEFENEVKNSSGDYRHFSFYWGNSIIYSNGKNYDIDHSSLLYPNYYNFFSELNEMGYTHVFVLKQDGSEEAMNQVAKLTAHPYQYNLIFNLDGGSAEFGEHYKQNNNGDYTEIVNELTKTYTIADGAVDAYMPTVKPTKEDSVFLGWKLYQDGEPVDNDKIYDPNEAFSINETSIKYSDGDITSDTGHTFTFVAQWENVATSTDSAALYIETYVEVPTNQEGAVYVNDKYYILNNEKDNNYGTVNNPSILIKYDNPNSNMYVINSNSKLYIEKVKDESDTDSSWKDNNTFKVYYDFIDYNLTVKKEAKGDYADLTKTWKIKVTLKDSNSNPISNTSFSNDYITDSNGEVTLQLKNNDSFTFENLNINTQFTIEEINPSHDYTVTYQINNKDVSTVNNSTLSSNTTVTVINTMKDLDTEIPDTNIPTSGMNSSITMLATGSIGIMGVVILLWYWRKKHV